jgi:hypothetical protein
MHLRLALVTNEQPLEVVQPSEGALDDPAVAAEGRTVLGVPPGIAGLIPRCQSRRRYLSWS